MYRLHCFGQSGNSFKVAFMLRALGQQFEAVHVDFLNGATRDAQWRESTNDMGEAPVLEDGKRSLTQSGAILTYLADKHGKFGGDSDEERQEILRWILFDNHKFTSYFATYRFARSFGPSAPDPVIMAWLKTRIDAAYSVVDKHLATRKYMVGAGPTIADFSLSGYLFYPLEESGYDVAAGYPHIAAWVARLKQVPGWAPPYEVMPGERIAPRWAA
jgi:glutathione S-transferase